MPVVVLPAVDGTEHIRVSTGELCYYLRGKAGKIGDYLCDIFVEEEGEPEQAGGFCNSRQRTIWDIAAIAFMRDPDKFCRAHIVPARTVDERGYWADLNGERKMIYVDRFIRDFIFSDFFTLVQGKCKEQ